MRILPLADFHLGDIHSDFKKIQEYLAYIKDNDNVFTVLNGDMMDAAIQSSIGDTYGASLQPMEQLAQCVKIFEPIKDKILAVTPGNHEQRIYKSDGLDLTQLMCNQLGIGERYSNTVLGRKTDFVKLADAFGAENFRVDTPEGFRDAFRKASECNGPCLIEVLIDKDEFVLPMLPPGGSIDDIIVSKERGE